MTRRKDPFRREGARELGVGSDHGLTSVGVIAGASPGNCRVLDLLSCASGPERMLYFRFDGAAWKGTYLAKGGPKLYAAEEDYIGLGALVPDDPTTIYISTPYNPTTDALAPGGKREIWRGTTCDNGATFRWTPVTANSTNDNIRPIVPKWDSKHTALLWMQGSYTSAQSYATAIVGVLSTKPRGPTSSIAFLCRRDLVAASPGRRIHNL